MSEKAAEFLSRDRAVFDLEREAPALYAAVRKEWPHAIKAYEGFGKTLFAAPTVEEFADARHRVMRPPFHKRCYYASSKPIFKSYWQRYDPAAGVIAIKGTEPLARDVDAGLTAMTERAFGMYTRANHFAAIEQKIPLALKVSEALREAHVATAFQAKHLRAYGHLARMPLPILALRLGDDVAVQHAERVRRIVNERAWDVIRPFFAEGLAVYAYAYPCLPTRPAHYAHQAVGLSARLAETAPLYDALETVSAWIRLFARILHLGYFPCSLQNLGENATGRGIGQMCNPNNTTMAGGFVDVDSMNEMSAATDEEYPLALELSIRELLGSVRYLLVGTEAPGYRSPIDADILTVERFFWRELEAAMKRERVPRQRSNSRLQALLFPTLATLRHRVR